MLKPHELFIGAALNKKDKNGFSPLIIDAKYLAWIERDELFFNKTFQPIPLTPEILTDWCGFELRESSTCKVYHKGINPVTKDWYIDLTWLDKPELIGAPNCPFYRNGGHNIKYLHQLQALYALLTGEVMEINLPKNQ